MTDDGGDIPPLTDGWFERLEQDLEKDEVLYFPGQQIGGFRLIEPLGSGGLGMVWKANRIQPPQTVAIKFIKPGLMTPFNRHLFMREQTTLARMNHPGIAVAIDPEGMTERQRPYLVMEFVDGRPITDYCDREGLGIPERLELFIQVCDALQRARIWDIDSGVTLIEFPSSLRGRRTAIDPTGQRIVIADRDATIVDCVPRHVRFAEEQAERLGRPLDTGADFSADLGADFVRELELGLPATWLTDRERTERKPAFLP